MWEQINNRFIFRGDVMKNGVRIVVWSVTAVIAGILIWFLAYWHAFLGANYYTYLTLYPSACWSDDGKQIIYLEHKEIERYGGLRLFGDAGRIIASKTYLMIMDANGKNKKIVGEVPEYGQKKTYENDLYNLSKDEAMRLGNRIGNIRHVVLYKDLPDIWKKIEGAHYYDISPDSKIFLYYNGIDGSINTMDLNGKKQKLGKASNKRKCYLFLPPWWKV